MGWVISSRMPIKQVNFRTELDLIAWAEPLAVFASLQGAPYPGNFLDLAYNHLLQNHGHDSIGACGRDIVYEDVVHRFRQSREISRCVTERALMDIAGDIDLSGWKTEEMALVVYNPAPFARTEVVEAGIEIPREWECQGFRIVDDDGREQKCQAIGVTARQHSVVQSPNDIANTMPSARHHCRVEFLDIPSMGYRTFKVVGIKAPRNSQPGVPQPGPFPGQRRNRQSLGTPGAPGKHALHHPQPTGRNRPAAGR